jgi:RNA polymerase sigma-70 factor, ECF subfamily
MGLLALMLFHRARQAARVNDRGDLVTLEGQDRTRWDQTQIELARRHLEAASPHGGPASSYAAWCGGWPASR